MNLKKTFLFALLISLFAHLFLALFLQFADFNFKSMALAEPIWIDLKKGEYQIADIPPPVKEERPKETKLLGMYDSRVEEEKVAPTNPGKWRTENRKQRTENREPKTENRELKTESGELRTENRKQKTDLGSLMEPLPPEDYFPDFNHGAHTYLNVLRFPDVQYFVMLKKVFRTTFNPMSSLEEAYFQNRITMGKVEVILGLSIDPQGNLAELFVLRGSGIPEYDEESLRTIRASAPFAKPPAKLLEGDSLLRMSWTFTVYL